MISGALLLTAVIAGPLCAQVVHAKASPERTALAQKILDATKGMPNVFTHADGSELDAATTADLLTHKNSCGLDAIDRVTPDNAHAGNTFSSDTIARLAVYAHNAYDICQAAAVLGDGFDIVIDKRSILQ